MTQHEQTLKDCFERIKDELRYQINQRSEVGDPLDMVYGYLCDLYEDWLAHVEPAEETL